MIEKLREEASRLISGKAGVEKKKISESLETPPDPRMGDIAFPCFILSKKMRKPPADIALKLSKEIKPSGNIKKIEARGGYLNLFVDWDPVAKEVISMILKEREKYGKSGKGKERIMTEFCHANTHKAFHIGHIRTLELGESLSRILESAGHGVIRTNYQGDIGPHVARCLWGILNLSKEKEPKDRGRWLGEIYAKASKKIKDDDDLKKEVDEINRKLYQGDKKTRDLWKKTRKWSLDYFEEIYKQFGVKFDRLYFESETEKPGTRIVKSLLKRKIASESDGAVVVDLKKHGLGVTVLITSQGTPLYHAKDLGLAELKMKEFSFDKSVHVVGSEQQLYFQQLFKMFELMKSPMYRKSCHLSYELVALAEGKMSSREGVVILYEDLLKELRKHASEETKKRNREFDDRKIGEISDTIALAALKYNIVKVSPGKRIMFDWKDALDFEGNAAPYLLYTYARAKSIIRKSGKEMKRYDITKLKHPLETEIIRKLAEFPSVIRKSARDLRPHYVSGYVYELSTKFNEFYNTMPVIRAPAGMREARLALVEAVAVIIRNSLSLLCIDVLERM